MSTRVLKHYSSTFWSRVLASTCDRPTCNSPFTMRHCSILTLRLLEPFARYKAAKYLMTKSDLRLQTSRTADLGWDTHLTQNDTGWGQSTRQIATRSVQSFFAQGSGDLTSRHVCKLSSNHEHSTWLWQTNRHDDEKHSAQLKLRREKWIGL